MRHRDDMLKLCKILANWIHMPHRKSVIVSLEWVFSPPDYFEEPITYAQDSCEITIADGKAIATIDAASFDANPTMRQTLDEDMNGRFLGVQLVTHQPFKLSNSSMTRTHPDGRKDHFVEIKSVSVKFSGGLADVRVTNSDGIVISDTKRDRIDRKRKFADLVADFRQTDKLLRSIIRSYDAAVRDPDDELVHLYEIRDAVATNFGGEKAARKSLGITDTEWSTLGRLCNKEPLRQGRHRGSTEGSLRDATESELAEARAIAMRIIEAYLEYLS